jgi:hypothetical protein
MDSPKGFADGSAGDKLTDLVTPHGSAVIYCVPGGHNFSIGVAAVHVLHSDASLQYHDWCSVGLPCVTSLSVL